MISLDKLPSNMHIYDLAGQKWISMKTNNHLEDEVYNFGPNDAPILRQIADWLDVANGIKKLIDMPVCGICLGDGRIACGSGILGDAYFPCPGCNK